MLTSNTSMDEKAVHLNLCTNVIYTTGRGLVWSRFRHLEGEPRLRPGVQSRFGLQSGLKNV